MEENPRERDQKFFMRMQGLIEVRGFNKKSAQTRKKEARQALQMGWTYALKFN